MALGPTLVTKRLLQLICRVVGIYGAHGGENLGELVAKVPSNLVPQRGNVPKT